MVVWIVTDSSKGQMLFGKWNLFSYTFRDTENYADVSWLCGKVICICFAVIMLAAIPAVWGSCWKNQKAMCGFQRMVFAFLTVLVTVHAYVFYSLYVVNGSTLMQITGADSVIHAINAQGGVYMFGIFNIFLRI